MPAAKKSNSAASKATTNTPRPRGRPPTKKVIKSSEFVDDEADEVMNESDGDKKSISKASTNTPRPRGRPSTKKIVDYSETAVDEADEAIEISDDDQKSSNASKASIDVSRPRGRSSARKILKSSESIDEGFEKPRPGGGPPARKVLRSSGSVDNGVEELIDTSDDEDMKSVKSSASRSRSRPSSFTRAAKYEDRVDVSAYDSDDDAMSVKSTKSVKSAMSVDDDNFVATTPRRSRSFVPKTPSSRASSRKRSASAMTSPITDDEDFEMVDSPTKRMAPMQRVRFDNAAKSVTPLKSVLKRPEVVLPFKNSFSKSAASDEGDDVFGGSSYRPKASSGGVSDKKSKIGSKADGDELQSPFEYDEPTPRKGSANNKATSRDSLSTAKGKSRRDNSSDEESTYLEDQVTSESSPDVDETNDGNRDPELEDSYKGLANIRAACVISWSNKKGPGLPCYTGIQIEIPKINNELLYQAVTFGGSPKFFNLSRTDPAKISTGVGSSTYFHAVGGGTPIVFLSTIVVKDCNLQDAKISSTGRCQKVIEGACIEGEWERLVGAIGHVIHAREFKAQYYVDNLSFATAYDSSTSSPSTFRGTNGNRRPSGSSRFSRGPGGGGTSPALACHDIVPIYDGRKHTGNFYALLADLDRLKRFPTEIPSRSCAVVAYTVNTWGREDPVNVSFNIRWAMLLGIPSQD